MKKYLIHYPYQIRHPCSKEKRPGVNDTGIVLGSFIDQSEPTESAGAPRVKVLDGFWKYLTTRAVSTDGKSNGLQG